eukprot:284290-Chlamydomonas_euryale.AAC.2
MQIKVHQSGSPMMLHSCWIKEWEPLSSCCLASPAAEAGLAKQPGCPCVDLAWSTTKGSEWGAWREWVAWMGGVCARETSTCSPQMLSVGSQSRCRHTTSNQWLGFTPGAAD